MNKDWDVIILIFSSISHHSFNTITSCTPGDSVCIRVQYHRCLMHIKYVVQFKLMESPSTALILVVIGSSIGLFGLSLLRMVDIFKKRKENVTSFRARS
jgi:hypothetical protein